MPHISLPGPITVVDVETTGLFPGHGDRVIEIALVTIEPDGSLGQEFVSLVNPERDVGPCRIHGITATDVIDAPKFSELIPNLIEHMSGTVSIAGHNVNFDYRFLLEEFTRANQEFPALQKLCTMRLFGGQQKLKACCKEAGIEIPQNGLHNALVDCRASAELLVHLISRNEEMHRAVRSYCPMQIPKPGWGPAKPVSRIQVREAKKNRPYLIPRILENLPIRNESANPNTVLLVYRIELEKALSDRLITEDEIQHLMKVASGLNLSHEEIKLVHHALVEDLIDVASKDGIITKFEENDIQLVGEVLGVSRDSIAETMRNYLSRANTPFAEVKISTEPMDGSGKTVCFTGEMIGLFQGDPITRDIAKQLAEAAGFQVIDNVTKKLDILVLADPNSQSGKAKKARQYGTQILQEAAFWNLIGAGVE